MAALCRLFANFGKNIPQYSRNISLTSCTRIKRIIEKQEGNTLTIEAKIIPQEDRERLLRNDKKSGACILCSHGLEVKHTDVLILNQFLDSTGEYLPRDVTGLCKTQYKRVEYLIKMAKAAGLFPNIIQKKESEVSQPWTKFNTYYDEETIKYKYF